MPFITVHTHGGAGAAIYGAKQNPSIRASHRGHLTRSPIASKCLDASASSYSMPEYLQPKVAVWTSRGWILVRLDGCGTTDRRSLSAPHETMMGHLAGELSPGGNKH